MKIEIISTYHKDVEQDIFDLYQLQCIHIWQDCLNNHPDFLKTLNNTSYITYINKKDDKYIIDFNYCKSNGRNEKINNAYNNIIILIAKHFLREKWHITNNDKKLGGKLTKILKLDKKRTQSK